MLVSFISFPLSANEINDLDNMTTEYYLSYDMDEELILYSNLINEQIAPASLTKLMTALLVYETFPLSKIHEIILPDAYEYEGKVAYLKTGDSITTEQLLEFLLIYSANDSAYVSALLVSNNADDFISLMNTRAQQLGMLSTNYVNPDGLDESNHFTSINDLLKLSIHVIKNTQLLDISSKSYFYYKDNKYLSTNLLLDENYVGLKTGWTTDAGLTFIGYKYDANRNILTIVNKSKVDEEKLNHFNDTKTLYRQSFDDFKSILLIEDNQKLVSITNSFEKMNITNQNPFKAFGNIHEVDLTSDVLINENKLSIIFNKYSLKISKILNFNNHLSYTFDFKNNIFTNFFK